MGYVLIAGGVGITPLYSMCQTMSEHEDVRPVLLFLVKEINLHHIIVKSFAVFLAVLIFINIIVFALLATP